jgi:hypothetical protein
MIIDRLANASPLYQLPSRLIRALEYLRATDMRSVAIGPGCTLTTCVPSGSARLSVYGTGFQPKRLTPRTGPMVVKLDVGGFSKREAWINLSQETLKELAKDPKIAVVVEPFIELEPEEIKARDKQKEIVVKEVPTRLERPAGKIGLATAFLTPVGLALLAVLFLANLYAAFEIALFRQQPLALVLGAEGKGLRQLTRETCRVVARLDMPGEIKSLNVSNAAVLALYIGASRLGLMK